MFKNVNFFRIQYYTRSFSKLFSDWLTVCNGLDYGYSLEKNLIFDCK